MVLHFIHGYIYQANSGIVKKPTQENRKMNESVNQDLIIDNEQLRGRGATRTIHQVEAEERMRPINNPVPPAMQFQNKSTTSKNSYMYKVPQLDPRKLMELKKFLIQEIKNENEAPKQAVTETVRCSINLNTWYFLAIVFFQFFIAMLYVIGLTTTDNSRRIGLAILVSLTAVVYALWIWYLCWKVDLVDRYWGWVWLSVCFDMVGSAISGGAQLWYITFVFSVIDCIAVTIILSLTRKTWATFGLVIVLCLALIICGFQLAFAVQGQENITFVLSIDYLVLFGIALIALGYNLCKLKWSIRTKHEKWQILCCIYLMSIDLSFGLAEGIPGNLTWIWLTQITNAMFLVNLAYYLIVILEIKFGKYTYNILEKIKSLRGKKEEVNPNMMYQMADVLLTTDREYLKNPRKSVMGKPLAQCTMCYNQQSRFCYQNCKHVCIGHECILDWLKKGMKKCPLCRETSEVMLEVKRLRDLEFQIQNRYRIGN